MRRLLAFVLLVTLPMLVGTGLVSETRAGDFSVVNGSKSQTGSMSFAAGENIRLDADQEHKGNLYAAGALAIEIAGDVDGDAFLAGQKVELTGSVLQDLAVGSANARVAGNIGGDLRGAFADGSLEGRVGGDVLLFAAELSVKPETEVFGASVLSVGSVLLRGKFHGPVKIAGGRIRVEAEIFGDLVVEADDFEIGESARINGNLSYRARNSVEFDEDIVTGTIDSELVETPEEEAEPQGSSSGFTFVWTFYLAFASLIAGVLFWLFVQPLVDGAVSQADSSSGLAVLFVAGLVTSLVMVMLGFFCLPLFPISLATWCALAALLFFGGLIGKIILGRWLLKWVMPNPHSLLALLVGVFVMIPVTLVLGFIPWFGWLLSWGIWLILTSIGIGAVVQRLRGTFEAAPAGEMLVTNP